MTDRPKRKQIPIAVKLQAALIALGHEPHDVEWDHFPALGLRPVNGDGTDYDPPQLDPRYIVPIRAEAHARKTDGDHVPLSGDKSKIAKAKRIEEKQARFRSRVLREPLPATKPKRTIPSRPFPQRWKP